VSFFFIANASRANVDHGSILASPPANLPEVITSNGAPTPVIRNASGNVMPCTWEGCQKDLALGVTLPEHLTEHADSILFQWSVDSKCFWAGCTSKAIFKTVATYKRHLKNIHTEPLVCTQVRCCHKKPFRNQADLDRHTSTVHIGLRRYQCPFDTCEAEVKDFIRKDKWLLHIRETEHYGDAFCPYLHCNRSHISSINGFSSREDISVHFTLYHSGYGVNGRDKPYQCALGLCSMNAMSEHWGRWELEKHVKKFHSVESSDCYVASWSRSTLEGNVYVLRPENMLPNPSANLWLGDNGREIKWQECSICLQTDHTNLANANLSQG